MSNHNGQEIAIEDMDGFSQMLAIDTIEESLLRADTFMEQMQDHAEEDALIDKRLSQRLRQNRRSMQDA